MFGLLFILV